MPLRISQADYQSYANVTRQGQNVNNEAYNARQTVRTAKNNSRITAAGRRQAEKAKRDAAHMHTQDVSAAATNFMEVAETFGKVASWIGDYTEQTKQAANTAQYNEGTEKYIKNLDTESLNRAQASVNSGSSSIGDDGLVVIGADYKEWQESIYASIDSENYSDEVKAQLKSDVESIFSGDEATIIRAVGNNAQTINNAVLESRLSDAITADASVGYGSSANLRAALQASGKYTPAQVEQLVALEQPNINLQAGKNVAAGLASGFDYQGFEDYLNSHDFTDAQTEVLRKTYAEGEKNAQNRINQAAYTTMQNGLAEGRDAGELYAEIEQNLSNLNPNVRNEAMAFVQDAQLQKIKADKILPTYTQIENASETELYTMKNSLEMNHRYFTGGAEDQYMTYMSKIDGRLEDFEEARTTATAAAEKARSDAEKASDANLKANAGVIKRSYLDNTISGTDAVNVLKDMFGETRSADVETELWDTINTVTRTLPTEFKDYGTRWVDNLQQMAFEKWGVKNFNQLTLEQQNQLFEAEQYMQAQILDYFQENANVKFNIGEFNNYMKDLSDSYVANVLGIKRGFELGVGEDRTDVTSDFLDSLRGQTGLVFRQDNSDVVSVAQYDEEGNQTYGLGTRDRDVWASETLKENFEQAASQQASSLKDGIYDVSTGEKRALSIQGYRTKEINGEPVAEAEYYDSEGNTYEVIQGVVWQTNGTPRAIGTLRQRTSYADRSNAMTQGLVPNVFSRFVTPLM